MTKKLYPRFDYSLCMACRICADVCPSACLEDRKTGIDSYGKVYPELARPDTCTSCGLCESSCPVAAISMV
jgi:ferredoxin